MSGSIQRWDGRIPVSLFILVALLFIPIISSLSFAQERLSLPVLLPSLNQAYRDASGMWGDCRMGTAGCPDRIATAGCLITVFAMVLDYYQIELSVSASSSCTGRARTGMDPGILNDWLKAHGGYGRCAHDEAGNCCLEWGRLPSQLFLSFHENQSEWGVDLLSQRIIDQALAKGYPVVAGVHWGSSCRGNITQKEDCHWVVVTGKVGLTYEIVDPYNRDPSSRQGVRTVLQRGTLGSYIIDRFVVVSGPTPVGRSGGGRLVLSFAPDEGPFHEGDVQRRFVQLDGIDRNVLLFARVTDPQGQIYYVYYPTTSSLPTDPIHYSKERRSLYPGPLRFGRDPWEWDRTVLSGIEPGVWTWEMWAEDPATPGERLADDTVAYTVEAGSLYGVGVSVLVSVLVIGVTVLLTVAVYAIFLANRGG